MVGSWPLQRDLHPCAQRLQLREGTLQLRLRARGGPQLGDQLGEFFGLQVRQRGAASQLCRGGDRGCGHGESLAQRFGKRAGFANAERRMRHGQQQSKRSINYKGSSEQWD
jgi:hypothetical protein